MIVPEVFQRSMPKPKKRKTKKVKNKGSIPYKDIYKQKIVFK